MSAVDPTLVAHIATLANIPVTDDEKKKLAAGFTTTLAVVDGLAQIDTTNVEPTHQVTGLESVFREDEVDLARMFSQAQALQNARRTYTGYFVVDQILGD